MLLSTRSLTAALLLGGLTAGMAALAAAPARRRAVTAPARVVAPPAAGAPQILNKTIRLSEPWQQAVRLEAGQPVEISVRLDRPSELPPNGRVAVEWTPAARWPERDVNAAGRPVNAFGIYTAPAAGFRKVLHALDGDIWLTYSPPVSGDYRLTIRPVTDEKWSGDTPRWREKGLAPEIFPLPEKTPWASGTSAALSAQIRPLPVWTDDQVQRTRTLLETEPNDTPEQANPIRIEPQGAVTTWEITGSSDDIEFFDNGQVGKLGDDWFRVSIGGDRPALVTAQLAIPGQFLVGQIRTYRLKPGAKLAQSPSDLLPIEEWTGNVNPQRLPYTEGKQVEVAEGRDPNERAHQQEEEHRTTISRLMSPGQTYYLRVEANAPGYQLQLRMLPPAPYDDPQLAIRQGMYNHIGQVDSWLANRPRGAGVERRIRDTGNLLGTQCMSCHTQSGVWGPTLPIANGYEVENPQSLGRLINIMYECLRPTNELKDAANNTSLAPLDIGDGPAGTRAAGFNIVNAERNFPPRKLHSSQQLRTANYVLLTADPGGINAAGPGSNIGRNIVWLFASEILLRAWRDTSDPRYFRKLEEKARFVLEHDAKFTDDLGVRLDYFGRLFPLNSYAAEVEKASARERSLGQKPAESKESPADFTRRVREQLAKDEARLRAIQNEDGSWGFNPGKEVAGGWQRAEKSDWDPSPTALAITGLYAVGHGREDPSISLGVAALLKMQDPNGRWNRASITGFVPTAYVLRALAPLYPVKPPIYSRADFTPRSGESFLDRLSRTQRLALRGTAEMVDLLAAASRDSAAPVRWWAQVGLGRIRSDKAVPLQIAALRDRAKPVREAAAWGLKQSLLDDRGWEAAYRAYETGDDYIREGVMQALGLRADAVMPKASVQWDRLSKLLSRAMNDDPHPAVRAWASKAAWQWWIWNPPIRPRIQQAWVRMLERPETNRLVENNNRYSNQALFIANGHKANGSEEHQYRELETLFTAIAERMEKADPAVRSRMATRLAAVAGTFFQQSGGDGGPGQLGYKTPGSGTLFGEAVLVQLKRASTEASTEGVRRGLQSAANIPHGPLQEFLIDYTLNAPEELRKEAAAAVSDPRSAKLQAATELVEPLIAQVMRGAAEPARRDSLSDPVIQLFSSVNWIIPENQEQQRHFLDLMIPRLPAYRSPAEIAAIADAGERAAAERETSAAWYLADRLGRVLGENPDLHLPMVFDRYFPQSFDNPLVRHFWVRSAPWLLAHATGAGPAGAPVVQAPDKAQLIKERALQLYLGALGPDALPETRAAAVRSANTTSVRKNPEVLVALGELLKFEKDDGLKRIAENVVKQGSEKFVPDLIAALKAENRPGAWLGPDGKPNPLFFEDFIHFRDYVIPELARVKRNDQLACLGCHGVPGRVPSLQLAPVDEFGYQSVQDLLKNYRELQARVDYKNIPQSKLLRKPLNVQDGQEDGHQGGRRYLPDDPGYLLLKSWSSNQPRVHEAVGAAPPDAPAAPPPASTPPRAEAAPPSRSLSLLPRRVSVR